MERGIERDGADRAGAAGGGGGAAGAARPGAAAAGAAGDGQGGGAGGGRGQRSRAGAGAPRARCAAGCAAFREGGVAGAGRRAAFRDARRRPMPPIWRRWRQAVATPPRTLGLPFDVWTSARLSAYLAASRPACASPRAGCGCCCTGSASPAAGPNTPWPTCKTPPKWPPARKRLRAAGEKGGGAAGAVRVAL